MSFCLADVQARQRVKIISLGTSGSLFRKKLLAMGLTPGTEVNVTRKAPMGGPLELFLRGFSLSLRKNEAQSILVEPLP